MPPQLWWHQRRAASSSLPHPPFAAPAGLHDTTGVPEQVLPAVYLGGDNVFITIPAKPNVTAPGAVLLEETDIPEYHMPGGVAARMGWWGHRRSRAGQGCRRQQPEESATAAFASLTSLFLAHLLPVGLHWVSSRAFGIMSCHVMLANFSCSTVVLSGHSSGTCLPAWLAAHHVVPRLRLQAAGWQLQLRERACVGVNSCMV